MFYFGYDEKAWTLEQLLFEIGKAVYDRFEQAQFQAMSQRAQVPKLVATLKGKPYALMLDNLESVTGQELAIQNTLPPAEQEQIRSFLVQLVAGKTKVVLGSRSGEDWLESAFRDNRYELDPESRSVLAEKILERHVQDSSHITTLRQEEDFQRLMKLLAGYPLAMEVVLANLGRQTPTEILAGLDAADVDLDVASADKTRSILQCVEYSFSVLSPEAQRVLVCLAPFCGFIDRQALPQHVAELEKLDAFAGYDFGGLDNAVQDAIDWGLLSPMEGEKGSPLLVMQPVFPFFLKTKLAQVKQETRTALEEGFKNYYRTLAGSYRQLMEPKEAEQKKLGLFFCKLEYENLYSALQTCLEKQEDIAIFFCLDKYLEIIQDPQSELNLATSICQILENYSSHLREGNIGYQIGLAFEMQAYSYVQLKQYEQAKTSYQKVLDIYQQLKHLEEGRKKQLSATIYHQLGIVAQELREYEQARRNYQQALEIKIEYGDRYSQARTYHQLGRVAQELREYQQARRNYQQALEIFVEYGDRYSQARTYHQLGMVAQELREYEQARRNYQQALEIFVEYGDRYSQARTYFQLGKIAEVLEELEEAKINYSGVQVH